MCGTDGGKRCIAGAQEGTCEPSGYCSFPDPFCPSGRRYGELSGALAGVCVDPGPPAPSAPPTADPPPDPSVSEDSGGPGVDEDVPSGSSSTGEPEDTGSTGVHTDPSPPSDGGSTGWGGSSGTAELQQFEIPPSIAVCTDPAELDPDLCAEEDGPHSLNVDLDDAGLDGQPATAWILFELPDELLELDVQTVVLRLVVTDDDKADAPNTGEVWQTGSFDAVSLTTSQPSLTTLVGDDGGPVTQGDVVEWSLGPGVASSSSLFLAVAPTDDDGVNYWNADGPEPPVLVIEAY